MKKRWAVIFMLALLSLSGSFMAEAAEEIGPYYVGSWKQEADGRWYYLNGDGSYPAAKWEEIDETWYYFDDQGYMVTGWVVSGDGTRYWTDESGAMAHDTTMAIDGIEYIFGEDGACQIKYKEPVAIPAEEEKSELHHAVDAIADSVLAQITNDQMSKTDKARAIYSWVRNNIRYVSVSQKGDWVQAAYDGLRKKHGDCYTYYAVALALLNRADIPSIEVNRLDGNHWWNLINCGEGWYHFDTCPRSDKGVFCLLTDAQLLAYSSRHVTGGMPYGSHGFDQSLYPPTP